MIAKLVAWGGIARRGDRADARALREYQVLGIRTTIPFFRWLMRQPDYLEGRYDTTYLDRLLESSAAARASARSRAEEAERIAIAAALDAYPARQRRPRRPAGRGAQRVDAARPPGGAARDDLRGRGRRPDVPGRRSSAWTARGASASSSTACRSVVDVGQAGEFGLSLLTKNPRQVTAAVAKRGHWRVQTSTDFQLASGRRCAASCWSASRDGPSA